MEEQTASTKAGQLLPIKGILLLILAPLFIGWAVWLVMSTEVKADVPNVYGPGLVQAFEVWKGQVSAVLADSDNEWGKVQELLIQQQSGYAILQASQEARKVHRWAKERLEDLEGRSPSEMSENQLRSMGKVRGAFVQALQKRSVFCTWLEAMGEGQKIRPDTVSQMAQEAEELMVIAKLQLGALSEEVHKVSVGQQSTK